MLINPSAEILKNVAMKALAFSSVALPFCSRRGQRAAFHGSAIKDLVRGHVFRLHL